MALEFFASNTDDDTYFEEISWGTSTGFGRSSYEFIDNSSLKDDGSSINLGDQFTIGTFRHNNFPITGGTITGAQLDLNMNIEIDGADINIDNWNLYFNHWETPNSGDFGGAPSANDGVLIKATDLVTTQQVGDVSYTASIVGYKVGNQFISPVAAGSADLGRVWPNGQVVEEG